MSQEPSPDKRHADALTVLMDAVQYAVNRLDSDGNQPQVAGDLAVALAYCRDRQTSRSHERENILAREHALSDGFGSAPSTTPRSTTDPDEGYDGWAEPERVDELLREIIQMTDSAGIKRKIEEAREALKAPRPSVVTNDSLFPLDAFIVSGGLLRTVLQRLRATRCMETADQVSKILETPAPKSEKQGLEDCEPYKREPYRSALSAIAKFVPSTFNKCRAPATTATIWTNGEWACCCGASSSDPACRYKLGQERHISPPPSRTADGGKQT